MLQVALSGLEEICLCNSTLEIVNGAMATSRTSPRRRKLRYLCLDALRKRPNLNSPETPVASPLDLGE